MITCVGCGEVKERHCNNLCHSCYKKQWHKNNPNYDRERRNQKPMIENKSCPLYLGVVVAEQVLSKVFKNINQMPFGNKGFDFICNNGYKVDSKASTKRIVNKKSDYWSFNIRKNQIADYFALLAFDNHNDITPLYFWLIPGNIINNKQTISISKSTNKWNEYKQDINKVIGCCNMLKGE